MLNNIFQPEFEAPTKIHSLLTQSDTHSDNGKTAQLGRFGFNISLNVGEDEKAVQLRRKQLLEYVGGSKKIAWLNQVRGDRVLALDELGEIREPLADASFTFMPDKVCVVSSADCLPVLLTDQSASFVAAVHAGWQGLHLEIIAKTLNAIRKAAEKQTIHLGEVLAYIAPSIAQHHYQVGQEFYDRFVAMEPQYSESFVEDGEGKYLADLKAIAKRQLKHAGVQLITDSNICTYADERFYSYRKAGHEKKTNCGRFVSMIWKED